MGGDKPVSRPCEVRTLPKRLNAVESMAERLRAWDTLAMVKLWRREVVSSASMAEWLRAWDTLAMMKLCRREVMSSIPDRGTIVG